MAFIKVKVFPDSKKDNIVRKSGDSFEISVRVSTERGEATAAALSLLGDELGIPPSKIRVVKGMRSRSKILEVKE